MAFGKKPTTRKTTSRRSPEPVEARKPKPAPAPVAPPPPPPDPVDAYADQILAWAAHSQPDGTLSRLIAEIAKSGKTAEVLVRLPYSSGVTGERLARAHRELGG